MRIRRVAMLCVHTSPLDQPGVGDAGGLNVYVAELSRQLANRGIEVDLFTRATKSNQPLVVPMLPGVHVRHVLTGPFTGLDKVALTSELCAFAAEVMRMEATHGPGHYDVIHSHYWLSGKAGAMIRARSGIPLVHTMHTLAKVKNATLPYGDQPEPLVRIAGEADVVHTADRLVANSAAEAAALIRLYGADPDRVVTVHPGVDLEQFKPGSQEHARHRVGLPVHGTVLLFVGRLQPFKGPDVVLRTAAELIDRDPAQRESLTVVVIGGPSGSGANELDRLHRLACQLGLDGAVQFVPPLDRRHLGDWYRAADVTVVPSRSETFGLVALESQASGTPVVAASVGGLQTAVRDGHSGLLVPGHEPSAYADAIERVLRDHDVATQLRRGARTHAEQFGWDVAAERLLQVYADTKSAREPAPALQLAAG
jgi:D-inositol-3-phosphate glycosyltransferase